MSECYKTAYIKRFHKDSQSLTIILIALEYDSAVNKFNIFLQRIYVTPESEEFA